MHDVGRSRLHSLERQQAGLNNDLKAVFETLEADEIAYGAQAGLVARHIRALCSSGAALESRGASGQSATTSAKVLVKAYVEPKKPKRRGRR